MTRVELLASIWPGQTFPAGDLVLEAVKDDDVIAHVDVYWKTVRVAGRPIQIAAIGQVCTDVAWRRQGFASALVTAAHSAALSMGRKYAAIFAGDYNFYARLGYEAQPSVAHFMTTALWSSPWPEGEIELSGQTW